MPKILVVQTAFIGDAILSTALLEKLHGAFPRASLDLMVRKGNEALFHHHPYLNKLYVWDKGGGKYSNLLKSARKIRRCRYDYLINLQRFWSTGMLALFSRAEQRIGFSENPLSIFYTVRKPYPFDQGLHEVARIHHLIAHLTDNTPGRPALYPSPADVDAVAPLKAAPYVCLAPASVWFTKRLPPSKWVALARRLLADFRLFFIGAPEDRGLCDDIAAELPRGAAVKNLCGELSLLQSAALIKDARMNYVNDSAPLHLASGVNGPTTAFFCSTVVDFGFGPLAETARVAQIEGDLHCRPCGIHGRRQCPEGHFRCGHEIDVTQYLPD